MMGLHCNEITILHGNCVTPEPVSMPRAAKKRTLQLVQVNNKDLTARMLELWGSSFLQTPSGLSLVWP